MTRRTPALLLVLVLLLGACASGGGDDDLARSESPDSSVPETAAPRPENATTTAVPETTTTTVPAPPEVPALPASPGDGQARVVVTPTGVVAAVLGLEGAGYRIRTPCGREASIPGGAPISGATVVLDPGHGGAEPGAVGQNGLTEKALNLVIAERTKAALETQGATVVLTRTADYRVTLGARADIVRALGPPVFVSIHHNGGSDGPSDKPGTETFFQIASPESRRLAGLVYEELFALFSTYEGIPWQADTDAGAKSRPNSSGGDYYGMLRLTAGVPSVLSEALFLSNPPEAELLARLDVQQAEAEALARAVTRFLTTDDPGSGFTQAYPRTEPAGPGGGSTGCIDPPLA
ncbi:MAG: N-acetylmuramoyl-L-alanine amidase [Acidimicrobiales bacterium]